MRIKFIINPSAGKQIVQKTTKNIIARLEKEQIASQIDVFETQGKDDAKNEAAKLEQGQYDLVVAVGGDGTVNEVVNGVIQSKSDTPLAILAAGTVNDFAKAAKLPRDVAGFCKMVQDGNLIACDVGCANGDYFLNVLAGGLLTDVAYKVSSDTKTVLGKLAYYLEGAKDLPANLFKSVPLCFEYGDHIIEEDVFLFLVTNSNSVGGFHRIAPLADISDGMLDVCIIKKLELLTMLPMLFKLPWGTHINDRGVIYFQTDSLKVSCQEDGVFIPLDYDGEQVNELPVEIKNLPQAIRLLVPSQKGGTQKSEDI